MKLHARHAELHMLVQVPLACLKIKNATACNQATLAFAPGACSNYKPTKVVIASDTELHFRHNHSLGHNS